MNTFLNQWQHFPVALITLLSTTFILLLPDIGNSQCFLNTNTNQYETANGEPCVNTIITAVPFLRIAPDARSAGMGDAGLATSADANAMHFNVSKLAFAEEKSGFSLNYTPWLRQQDIKDVFLGYASGYYKLNDQNALGLSFKYFSLGEIAYTNANGMPISESRPNELEISAAFAKKLSNNFSGGFAFKYIYSNLAAGAIVGGEEISAGKSLAADLSLTYQLPSLTFGLAINNLGSRITYTNSINKEFIPTNLGLGVAWHKDFGKQHRITLTTDLNKLMVPTPDFLCTDEEGDGVCDYKQKGCFSSILGSFSDAPNGFKEELKELMFSFGAELWIADFIAFRTGYFTEHVAKGGRKYMTTGLGLKYNVVTLNGSYLISTTGQNHPLNKTFRVSLLFNFGDITKSENS